jgi:hypothetical protein
MPACGVSNVHSRRPLDSDSANRIRTVRSGATGAVGTEKSVPESWGPTEADPTSCSDCTTASDRTASPRVCPSEEKMAWMVPGLTGSACGSATSRSTVLGYGASAVTGRSCRHEEPGSASRNPAATT